MLMYLKCTNNKISLVNIIDCYVIKIIEFR